MSASPEIARPRTPQARDDRRQTPSPDRAPHRQVRGSAPSLFYFCNVGWYFISHRLALAKAARERGYDVHVVCDIESPLEAETIRTAGLRFHRVHLSRGGINPLADLQTFARFLALLLKYRPTLTHNVSIKPIVYASIAARVARVRGVVNAISGLGYLFVDPQRAGLGRRIAQVLYRFSLRSRAVRAIFQNEDDQRYFVQQGLVRDAQTILIPGSGVDLTVFEPTAEPADTPVRIVLPARMLWDKGVGEFAAAALLLREAGLPVECLLAGGLDPANPAALAPSDVERLLAQGAVKWLGHVSDMPALLRTCHIVCLPSYREGLPKALLEACAVGRPIVTTAVPGCRDVVREGVNGLLVPSRDAHSLYVALATLVTDKQLRLDMGLRGREIAVREYDLDQVVGRTLQLYDRLASSRTRRAVPERKRLLMIVNDAGFFVSHRLPVALAARDAGLEVHVATAPGEAAAVISAHRLAHHPLLLSRGSVNPFRELRAFIEITQLLRQLRPHLVHLVTVKPVLYGGLAARLTGVPAVVAAISGLGNVFAETNIGAAAVRRLVTFAYRLALNRQSQSLRVIFQNSSDRDVLIGLAAVAPDKTILVKGSGVDLRAFRATPEPTGIPVVTFASRLLRSKGVGEFVAAAGQLRASGVQARFQLVGEMDPQSAASVNSRDIERWRRSGAVEIIGYRRDMAEIFAASNLVVLPSYYGEGLPKVLAEAAACGRAVVTTDWPGCRDAVEPDRTGVLVPPRDVTALAHAIRLLLSDPAKRRSMGIAARALAEREYSVDSIVAQHLEVYLTVLQSYS